MKRDDRGKGGSGGSEIGFVELRRGVVILAALSQLRRRQYGYSLRQALLEGGLPIEEGTLYPLLRRLEKQGVLVSEWDREASPPRRYYRLSGEGERVFGELSKAWKEQVRVMRGLLEDNEVES